MNDKRQAKVKEIKEETIISDLYDPDTIYKLDLDCVIDSEFEPQQKRIHKYKESELESLGNSIVKHSLRQPILVRPRRDIVDKQNPFKRFFEVVFGNRRKIASKLKGLKTIKCFIEDLNDAEVIELQYEENDKRKELDFLDNAFYFNFLQEKFKYTDEQIADRLNVKLKDVKIGLGLKNLIPEFIEQIENEKLPSKHASYIAGFSPEIQQLILKNGYAYRHGDINEGPVLFREFREEIEENIVRDLENAPFDPEDTRLHLQNLKCSNCPQNSAFKPYLYSDWQSPKGNCLDPVCFQFKTNVNLRIKTEEAAQIKAEKEHKPIEVAIKEVPQVTDRNWLPEDRLPIKSKILKNQELHEKPECEFSELSVAVGGAKKGTHVYICQNDKCPVHHSKVKELSQDELQLRENEFEQKIYQEQKIKVFSEAINDFNDYTPFWMFHDLIGELIATFLLKVKDSHGYFLKQILKDWKNVPKHFEDGIECHKFALSLDKRQQSQILFLLTYINEIIAYPGESEEKQALFQKIAKDYTKLDLRRVDAELRWKHAPDDPECERLAKEYFEKVINDEEAEKPSFWLKRN